MLSWLERMEMFCRYSKNEIGLAALKEEKRQWELTPFRIASYGIVSRTGFTDELQEDPELLLLDLEDLYR